MASKVISFRFGSAELEALQALQVPEDESVNQTAARLLRGLIGASTAVSTAVDIREVVRQEVLAAIADFRREIDERLGQYSAHEIAASVEQSPVSPSTTVDNELLQQLQEEIEQLRSRNLELETENLKLQEAMGNSLTPDYQDFRDRVLAKLKVGRQSAGGKAIDAFIKELKSQPLTPSSQLPTSNPPTVSSSGELFDGEQQAVSFGFAKPRCARTTGLPKWEASPFGNPLLLCCSYAPKKVKKPASYQNVGSSCKRHRTRDD